jgi:curved DNA-binding protein CbpA
MLYGPRAVATFHGPQDAHLGVDGLSPRQIFGLGPTFTRRELERARRRLAWDLHPDRHRGASLHERKAREDALKRVNAAFDLLIVDAT